MTLPGSLTAVGTDAGVYLEIGSSTTLVRIESMKSSGAVSYGDISIAATGSLVRPTGQGASATHLRGRDITLSSSNGGIGAIGSPLLINSSAAASTRTRAGIVSISALGDVAIKEVQGDLVIREIASSGGDVAIDVVQGSIFDASGQTAASVLSQEQIETIWSRLSLTGIAATENAQASVRAFESQVNTMYAEFWRLVLNGSITADGYLVSDSSVALYRPRAAAALQLVAPTDQQVRRYAAWLYRKTVAFFDNVPLAADAELGLGPVPAPLTGLGPIMGTDWSGSAAFAPYNPSFVYTATEPQQVALTSDAQWLESELRYSVNNAVFGASSGTPVGIGIANVKAPQGP